MSNEFCILQVEDDGNDVFLLEHAFRKSGVTDALRVAKDGQQAIDYLQGIGAFADRTLHPFPSLILLDLKLPRKDGFEVLKWVRQRAELNLLTVIVLTSSYQQEDVDRCYSLGANSFVVKPSRLEERLALTKHLQGYWLHFHRRASVLSLDLRHESVSETSQNAQAEPQSMRQ